MSPVEEYLNEKFIKRESYKKGEEKWFIIDHEIGGADYGVTIKKISDEVYLMETYEDSGYSPPREITTLIPDAVWSLIDVLRATNPSYKYYNI